MIGTHSWGNSFPPLCTSAVEEVGIFYLLEGLEGIQCLEGLERIEHLRGPKGLKGIKLLKVLEGLGGLKGLKSLQQILRLGSFVRIERLEGLRSLGGLEGVGGVEILERLERWSWSFGCFFRFSNRRLWASLFSDYLGSAHPFKNPLKKTTPKGEMDGLFEPIGMGSCMEGASPPEMMNCMHADLQIEVEKWILVDDWKTPVWHDQGSIFLVQKYDHFSSPEWSPINWP